MVHRTTTNRSSDRNHVIVLLSGGVDSTSTVEFLRARRKEMRALFVNYGQRAAKYEHVAATAAARYYGVPLQVIKIGGVAAKGVGEIGGRNALLLAIALAEVAPTTREIVIGIHAGTRYADCGPRFLDLMQGVADTYYAGRVQIVAPFLNWEKMSILAYARQAKIPIEKTYSCESGTGRSGCGDCVSCRDRRQIDACT